jgi:hypothetical protein
MLHLVGLPSNAASVIEGRAYCSVHCIRADFLESFETLDGMVGTSVRGFVTDLRVIYRELSWTFSTLLNDGLLRPAEFGDPSQH